MQKTILKFAVLSTIAIAAFSSCNKSGSGGGENPSGDNILPTGSVIPISVNANTSLVKGGTYILKGGTHVKPGATLTIPEGVTVKSYVRQAGEPDPGVPYLLIEPGAKIEAVGTASAPIVFTSGEASPKPQDWGGIILCGKAPVNVTGGVNTSEMGVGVVYGGTNAADNSGTLRYVRVEYTGQKQSTEKEHNGFTFEGVGNGTKVEYISSYRGGDDGIEFFGGTVDVKYAVVYGAQDDMFDYTFGWSGRAQFLLGVQEQVNNATFRAVGDRGFEADNNGDANSNTPWSNPKISNVTLVGSLVAATNDDPTKASDSDLGKTIGLKLRAGTRGQLYNMVVTNFSNGVDVQHDVTLAGMASGDLNLKNSDIANAKPWKYSPNSGAWTGAKPFETADYKNTVTSAFPSYLSKTTYVGTSATDALNPTTLDAWFAAATYKGAVSSSNNWLGAWAGTLHPVAQ